MNTVLSLELICYLLLLVFRFDFIFFQANATWANLASLLKLAKNDISDSQIKNLERLKNTLDIVSRTKNMEFVDKRT
jgi:hypothetical protein